MGTAATAAAGGDGLAPGRGAATGGLGGGKQKKGTHQFFHTARLGAAEIMRAQPASFHQPAQCLPAPLAAAAPGRGLDEAQLGLGLFQARVDEIGHGVFPFGPGPKI